MSKITFCPEKVCEEMRELAIRMGIFPDTQPSDIVAGIQLNAGVFAGIDVGPVEGSKSILKPVDINPDALRRKDDGSGQASTTQFSACVQSYLLQMMEDPNCTESERKSLQGFVDEFQKYRKSVTVEEKPVANQEKKP